MALHSVCLWYMRTIREIRKYILSVRVYVECLYSARHHVVEQSLCSFASFVAHRIIDVHSAFSILLFQRIVTFALERLSYIIFKEYIVTYFMTFGSHKETSLVK